MTRVERPTMTQVAAGAIVSLEIVTEWAFPADLVQVPQYSINLIFFERRRMIS